MEAQYLGAGDLLEWNEYTFGQMTSVSWEENMMEVWVRGCSFPFYFLPETRVSAYTRCHRGE